MTQELQQLDLEGLEKKLWRKSHSINTIKAFRNAIHSFKIFNRNNDFLNQDPYKTLDEFAGWLDEQGYRPSTIRNYISFIKRLYTHHGVSINSDLMKEKTNTPKLTSFQDEALEPELARRIILNCKHEALRIVLMLEKDTIARPEEILGLKLGDFNLTHDPPYLTIPSYLAKNNIAREVFFTNETKVILMDYLKNNNITKAEQFLFLKKDVDPIIDEKGFQWTVLGAYNTIFSAWKRLAEQECLKELREKVKQRGKEPRHKIHIYSFKKFAFTKIGDVLGPLAAHAIAGHEEYLITYYKKSREERKKDYLKVIPKLNLFTPSEVEKLRNEVKEEVENLSPDELREVQKALIIIKAGKASQLKE